MSSRNTVTPLTTLSTRRTWCSYTAHGTRELNQTLNDLEQEGFAVHSVMCVNHGVKPRFTVVVVRVETVEA